MASENSRIRRPGKRSDPRTLARFVEELSWLLSSYDELDFKALGDLSSSLASTSRKRPGMISRTSRSETVQMLVGVLPSFFIDLELFPSNEDIIEFSQLALGINIPRWQKKSKYELIGHIVCHTDQASPERLSRLIAALEDALDERGSARLRMTRERKSGRSWNEVIQSMLRDTP